VALPLSEELILTVLHHRWTERETDVPHAASSKLRCTVVVMGNWDL
jgi:hypothetical protein